MLKFFKSDGSKVAKVLTDRAGVHLNDFYPICMKPEGKWGREDLEDYKWIPQL